MTQYSVEIDMLPATVAALKNGNYFLYGFKAVRGQGSGMPTVWFSSQNFLASTSLEWSESYQSYISYDEIQANVTIRASAKLAIDLGQTMHVDANGNVTSSSDGVAGAVSIMNDSSDPYTCGLSQESPTGDYTSLCAFPLYGNGLDLIVPIETVLLMFATKPFRTATVIAQAFAQGVLIDLTGAPTRTVSFDINKGWDFGLATWAKTIPANSPLQPLLILPQATESLQAKRLLRA